MELLFFPCMWILFGIAAFALNRLTISLGVKRDKLPFLGALKGGLFDFIWIAWTLIDEPALIKDERMEMLIFLAIPAPVKFFWLPAAIALIAVTIVLGIMLTLSSRSKVRDMFKTGQRIERKPLK